MGRAPAHEVRRTNAVRYRAPHMVARPRQSADGAARIRRCAGRCGHCRKCVVGQPRVQTLGTVVEEADLQTDQQIHNGQYHVLRAVRVCEWDVTVGVPEVLR